MGHKRGTGGLAETLLLRRREDVDPLGHVWECLVNPGKCLKPDAVRRTREAGGRVVAVGTTAVRSLESAWDEDEGGIVVRENATTNLYLMPGSEFHVVDALITNFHVPRSTLMMLVSAFATREQIMDAYQQAFDRQYRFFSFGDAMFIE